MEREKFEAWAASVDLNTAQDENGYAFRLTDLAWRTWQARAALDKDGEPVAWLQRPKVQRFPHKPMVRGVVTTKPTEEQLEFAELDGDEYLPLYAKEKP